MSRERSRAEFDDSAVDRRGFLKGAAASAAAFVAEPQPAGAPDAAQDAHFLGETPQHLYSVRFAARGLWGERASSRDVIHLDMWDDYLERV